MRVPQVSERIKEAPAQALRGVFAGIGQLLLITDKLRNKASHQDVPQARTPGASEIVTDTPVTSPADQGAGTAPVDAAAAADGATLATMLRAARAAGKTALDHTPDLLAVLKDAGVVDAGGAGFLLMLDAALFVGQFAWGWLMQEIPKSPPGMRAAAALPSVRHASGGTRQHTPSLLLEQDRIPQAGRFV